MTDVLGRFTALGGALFGLVIALVGVAGAAIRVLFSFTYLWRTILFLGLLSTVGFITGTYNVPILQQITGIRCSVGPIYNSTLRPFGAYFQQLYNKLICWWDAFVIYPYLAIRDTIIPLLRQCNVSEVILNLFKFLKQFGQDFGRFFLQGDWLRKEVK